MVAPRPVGYEASPCAVVFFLGFLGFFGCFYRFYWKIRMIIFSGRRLSHVPTGHGVSPGEVRKGQRKSVRVKAACHLPTGRITVAPTHPQYGMKSKCCVTTNPSKKMAVPSCRLPCGAPKAVQGRQRPAWMGLVGLSGAPGRKATSTPVVKPTRTRVPVSCCITSCMVRTCDNLVITIFVVFVTYRV